jgi:hypothetical protein
MAFAAALESIDPKESPYANVFVDEPQSATIRLYGFVFGINSRAKNGITHFDFNLQNIMFQSPKEDRSDFMDRIIDFGMI